MDLKVIKQINSSLYMLQRPLKVGKIAFSYKYSYILSTSEEIRKTYSQSYLLPSRFFFNTVAKIFFHYESVLFKNLHLPHVFQTLGLSPLS